MATNAKQLACQLADLTQLDSKPYIRFQTHLLNNVLDTLPRTLAVLYEKLYIQQKTDKRHAHGVVMSQKQIGKLIRRHEDTAQQQLKRLEKLGYIRKSLSKYSKGLYHNQLCYEVVAPEEILSDIKNNVLDITKNPTLYKSTTEKSQGGSCENTGYSLYKYNIKNNTSIKSNIRVESLLTNLEPCFDEVEVLVDVPRETIAPIAPPIAPDAEPIAGVITAAKPQSNNSEPTKSPVCETESEIARFVTKAERIEIIRKLKAMRKAGEMHASVQVRYQDIMVLVHEVIVHCLYRDVLRCGFKHALNFAAKAIRNGTWTTPKRISYAATQQRERQAQLEKQREHQAYVGSGIAQRLGQTLRENYAGLSEQDLNKAKAGILEQGIRELGSNATFDRVRVLKDTVKQNFESPNKAQNTPIEREYPTHEQNVIWYAGLKDEDKITYYEYAVRKHAAFAKTLESHGLDYRSESFLKTTWFKMMMELIGRVK